jgi:hypothetical protein
MRKFAFIDTEFTGEHAHATLVSLAVVGMGGEQLVVNFNDYDRDQVTPWLRQNVLAHIDPNTGVSRAEGFPLVRKWFDSYSAGERVHLVSCGKLLDLLLVWELWHFARPDEKYFHHLHGLPEYFNHAAHFDLPTIFFLAGLDPNMNRTEFVGEKVVGRRHDALYDAQVVKECFLRCVNSANFPKLASML